MTLRYAAYPKELAKSIPRRFLDFRLRNFLTQKELGIYIGLSRWSITQIENDKQVPHFKSWRRFLVLEEQEKQGNRSFVPAADTTKRLRHSPRRRKKALPSLA
jgi:DNA-binding XRE family transcriptional regulator